MDNIIGGRSAVIQVTFLMEDRGFCKDVFATVEKPTGGFVQEMETVTLRERSPLFRFLSLNGEKRSAVLKSCQI